MAFFVNRKTLFGNQVISGIMDRFFWRKKLFLFCRYLLQKSRTYTEFIFELEANGFTRKLRKELLKTPIDADLHLHSYHSDGQLSPKHLVWLGKMLGLKGLALVDHDNISGLDLFVGEGKRLGLATWAGVEMKTDIPGCEILVYAPDSEAFLAYLRGCGGDGFREELLERQRNAHEQTIYAKDELNSILKKLGKTGFITDEEIARWYSGVYPFYPGTLCVLFLQRLSLKEREELGVFTPRDINIKYLTPILSAWKNRKDTGLESTFLLINHVRAQVEREGMRIFSVLAHPVELLRNAGMSITEMQEFILRLALEHGLDGLEINNARDTADDTGAWMKIWERVYFKLLENKREFYPFGFSSDFHILEPGKEGGTFTMGFGLLDEDHPDGNLNPLETWPQFTKRIGLRHTGPG